MTTAFTAAGQDIAQQMYALLSALDRAPTDDAVPSLRERAEALLARCRAALESDDARETTTQKLVRALNALTRALEELCARLARGDSARSAFTAFRTHAAPKYEAFAKRLNALRVSVPSLRPQNLARSGFHMVSATFAVLCIELLPKWGYVQLIAVAFFAFSWTLEIGRRYSDALRSVSLRLFGKFIHPHEHVRVNSATWYASALLILAFAFDPMTCALAVLALGYGDPAAAWVGRRWGRTRLYNARSLEGTLTFATVTFAGALLLLKLAHPELTLPVRFLIAGVAGISGAIAELFSGRVDDNFTIPVVVAASTAAALALVG